MAITTTMCTSYKKEVMDGVHDAADTYKIALYTSAATLDSTTTVYVTTDEVVGTGYTAGGATLTGYTSSIDGTTAILDWNDPSWSGASFTARGCLIYNSSKGDKAVAAYDFGSDIVVSSGTFTLVLPAPAAATAIVALA